MAKKTRKVGIVGKYGARYGVSLRKRIKVSEATQHAKYACEFCGKTSVRREAAGIWKCRSCLKVVAGGAYIPSTVTGVSVKGQTQRLRETVRD